MPCAQKTVEASVDNHRMWSVAFVSGRDYQPISGCSVVCLYSHILQYAFRVYIQDTFGLLPVVVQHIWESAVQFSRTVNGKTSCRIPAGRSVTVIIKSVFHTSKSSVKLLFLSEEQEPGIEMTYRIGLQRHIVVKTVRQHDIPDLNLLSLQFIVIEIHRQLIDIYPEHKPFKLYVNNSVLLEVIHIGSGHHDAVICKISGTQDKPRIRIVFVVQLVKGLAFKEFRRILIKISERQDSGSFVLGRTHCITGHACWVRIQCDMEIFGRVIFIEYIKVKSVQSIGGRSLGRTQCFYRPSVMRYIQFQAVFCPAIFMSDCILEGCIRLFLA